MPPRWRNHRCEARAAAAEIEPPDKKIPRAVLIVAGIAALNSANLGYDIGVMAGAALRVQDDWSLSDVKVEVLVGILNACAIAGAAIAHYVVDRLGRRRTFTVSSAVFIVGVLGMAAPSPTLCLGQCGLGVGVGLSVDPVCRGGRAAARRRSRRGSGVTINAGILPGFVRRGAGVGSDTAWRAMLALGAILLSSAASMTVFAKALDGYPRHRR